jgi:CRISPR/Cas system-associated endonuclease Cas1
MTVALLATGLDPGSYTFHVDMDGRSSLALDAIEAARPPAGTGHIHAGWARCS